VKGLPPATATEVDTSFVTATRAGAVRTVVVVLVGQVELLPVGVHPGPVHWAVLVTEPVADPSTVTSNVSVTADPPGTPAPIVHVIVPSDATLTVQLGGDDDDNDPHDADPATNAVPAGASSVIVTGASDVDAPLLVATNV
jgi:hypothetical protein